MPHLWSWKPVNRACRAQLFVPRQCFCRTSSPQEPSLQKHPLTALCKDVKEKQKNSSAGCNEISLLYTDHFINSFCPHEASKETKPRFAFKANSSNKQNHVDQSSSAYLCTRVFLSCVATQLERTVYRIHVHKWVAARCVAYVCFEWVDVRANRCTCAQAMTQ